MLNVYIFSEICPKQSIEGIGTLIHPSNRHKQSIRGDEGVPPVINMAARLITCFILVIMCYTDCDAMSFNLPNLKTGTIGLPTNLNTNLAPMAPAAIPAPIVAPSSVPGPSEPIPGPSPAIPGPSAAVPGLTAASPAPSGPGGQSSLGTFNPLSASKKQLNIFKDVDFAISPSAFGLDFNILKSKTETGLTQSNCGKKCTETDDCVMVLHCLMETSAPVTTAPPCVFEIGKPPCKFTPGGGKSSGRADEYCHIFKQTPTQEAFGNADWGSNCTYAVYRKYFDHYMTAPLLQLSSLAINKHHKINFV